MSRRRWVGFDPALSAFGFAVMNQEVGGQPTVLEMGTWRTRADDRAGKLEDRSRRFGELVVAIEKLLGTYTPNEAYIESPAMVPGKTSYHAIAAAARSRGIVEALCYVRGVELAEVRPDIVKQAVTGRRDASKDGVFLVLKRLYRLSHGESVDLNASDALAVAHVGAHRHGGAVQVSSGVVSYRRDEDLDALDF